MDLNGSGCVKLDKGGPGWIRMDQDVPGWIGMDLNGSEWIWMCQVGSGGTRMDQDGPGCSRMDLNGSGCVRLDQGGPGWTRMDLNGSGQVHRRIRSWDVLEISEGSSWTLVSCLPLVSRATGSENSPAAALFVARTRTTTNGESNFKPKSFEATDSHQLIRSDSALVPLWDHLPEMMICVSVMSQIRSQQAPPTSALLWVVFRYSNS